MIVYIFNSNTSNSTIPQQQSAKDRMRHILMAVPEVEPVCCRCFGISYSGRVTTPAYSCILEGTYNRKAVLKCMIGLFEFVVSSFYVICEITTEENSRNLQQTQNNNGGSSASTSPTYCLHAICCPQRQQNCTPISI